MSATARRPYATRRDHHVNYGDKTVLRAGQAATTLAEISVSEGQAFTCYVSARVEGTSTADVFPIVRAEWGHGGASLVAREFRVYRRLRIPVVGSTVRLSGQLVDAKGAPLPSSQDATANFVAFIAPGSDGETLRNTRWISQSGSEGVISDGTELVMTVQGYPAASSPVWVMLFDALKRPPNGTFPAMASPAARRFRLDRFDGQGFRSGVVWAASSTPMTLTYKAAANLRVDVEVLT